MNELREHDKAAMDYHNMYRVPRKKKKLLKRIYKHRYGFNWLKCDNIVLFYQWAFKNRFHINIYKKIA